MKTFDTPDIKLASILVALGIPPRNSDPITCIERSGGVRQYSFWFDITDCVKARACQNYVDAWNAMRHEGRITLEAGVEHPLYWMKGALENREVLLNWLRNDVEPMKLAKVGDWHVLLSSKAPDAVMKRLAPYIQTKP